MFVSWYSFVFTKKFSLLMVPKFEQSNALWDVQFNGKL